MPVGSRAFRSSSSLRSVVRTLCRAGGPAVLGAVVVSSALGSGCKPKQPAKVAETDIGACPDATKVSAYESADVARDFGVPAADAARVKNAVVAAAYLGELAAKSSDDLKVACMALAMDLGTEGVFPTAKEACNAAMDAVIAARTKLGPKAAISVATVPGSCAVPVAAMNECIASCGGAGGDAGAGAEAASCESGQLAGTCGGTCEGTCERAGGNKCDGACTGACDGAMKGKCGGRCTGKCDGKASKGAVCAGVCDGKCDADVDGECKGKCDGGCKAKGKVACKGTCVGVCSAEMSFAKCRGDVTATGADETCKARCDAKLATSAECVDPRVVVRVTGGDAKPSEALRQTLEKDLPLVVRLGRSMSALVERTAASVSKAAESSKGALGTSPKATSCLGGVLGKVDWAKASLHDHAELSREVRTVTWNPDAPHKASDPAKALGDAPASDGGLDLQR